MHEFSMVNQIFRKCLEVAKLNNATKISEINLEVGDFALIVSEHLALFIAIPVSKIRKFGSVKKKKKQQPKED